MKRYLVFMWFDYYPRGGMNDFKDSTDDTAGVYKIIEDNMPDSGEDYDSFHVYDTAQGGYVGDKRRSIIDFLGYSPEAERRKKMPPAKSQDEKDIDDINITKVYRLIGGPKDGKTIILRDNVTRHICIINGDDGYGQYNYDVGVNMEEVKGIIEVPMKIPFKDVDNKREVLYGGSRHIKLPYKAFFDEEVDYTIQYDSINITTGYRGMIGEETLVELVDTCEHCSLVGNCKIIANLDYHGEANHKTFTCAKFKPKG